MNNEIKKVMADPNYNSVKEFLDVTCLNEKDYCIFRRTVASGIDEHTYGEFRDDSLKLATAMIKNGLTGKSVACIAENRYEHCVCLFATMLAGAAYVPLNTTAEMPTLIGMLTFADAEAVFVSAPFLESVNEARKSCPKLETVIMLDETDDTALTYKSMLEQGDDYENTRFYGDFSDNRTAMLVYTSGTSAGKPKCVELTYSNIFANARYRTVDSIDVVPDKYCNLVTYSPLPMFHLACITFLISYLMPIGCVLCTSDTPKDSIRDITVFKPALVQTVPALAKVHMSMIEGTIAAMGDTEWFENFCVECDEGKHSFEERRSICKKYLAAVGGELMAVSLTGGAADVTLTRKFECLGISCGCDYGLTETSPVITCDMHLYKHRGAVGQIVPFFENKFVDGVLYIKGEGVMKGYYKNPEATKEAVNDGWFCTGDLAYADEEGFLYIKGRASAVVVLSNGDNIDIDELTSRFMTAPSISEIIIIGDKKNNNDTLGALIYPENGADFETVQNDIVTINSSLPIQQRIARFRLMDKPFEKNSMMKIKRFMYLEEEI